MKELIRVRVQYASRHQCCKIHKRPLPLPLPLDKQKITCETNICNVLRRQREPNCRRVDNTIHIFTSLHRWSSQHTYLFCIQHFCPISHSCSVFSCTYSLCKNYFHFSYFVGGQLPVNLSHNLLILLDDDLSGT